MIIFIIIVIAELFVLYRAFYRDEYLTEESKAGAQVRVNLDVFEKTKQWLEARSNYQKADYKLQEADKGRENPFLEY